jgi:hypothetical protein
MLLAIDEGSVLQNIELTILIKSFEFIGLLISGKANYLEL